MEDENEHAEGDEKRYEKKVKEEAEKKQGTTNNAKQKDQKRNTQQPIKSQLSTADSQQPAATKNDWRTIKQPTTNSAQNPQPAISNQSTSQDSTTGKRQQQRRKPPTNVHQQQLNFEQDRLTCVVARAANNASSMGPQACLKDGYFVVPRRILTSLRLAGKTLLGYSKLMDPRPPQQFLALPPTDQASCQKTIDSVLQSRHQGCRMSQGKHKR